MAGSPRQCGPKPFNYDLRLVNLDGTLGPWLTCYPSQGATGFLNDAIALAPAWTPDGQAVIFNYFIANPPPDRGSELWLTRPADPPDPTLGVPPRTRLTQGLTPDLVVPIPSVASDGVTVVVPFGAANPVQLYAFDRSRPLPVSIPAQATCLTCGLGGLLGAYIPAWAPGLP